MASRDAKNLILSRVMKYPNFLLFIADGPLGPSALVLDNWMLLSQNG